MAYRFSDTSKWSDEWFVDLSPNEKLLFMYLCDNCDMGGFYELSLRKLIFDTGLSDEDIKGALKGLQRGYILSEDKKVLFLKNFVKHQKNIPLNPDNKAHRGVISRFDNYSSRFSCDLIMLVNGSKNITPTKGLQSPTGIGKGIGTLKEISNDEKFLKIFERWIAYKQARKEMYKTDDSLKTAFKKLIKYSGEDSLIAHEIIDSAISNNYAGFFELNQRQMGEFHSKQQKNFSRNTDYSKVAN